DLNAFRIRISYVLSCNMRDIDKDLERLDLHLGDLEDDARGRVQILNRDIAKQVVLPRVEQILAKFKHVKGLEHYLKYYAEDIINNVEIVLEQEEDDFTPALFSRVPARYQA